MKRPFIPAGLLLAVAGFAALVHPRLEMPARKTEVEVAGQKLKIETRRIITIPALFSGALIVAGAVFIVFGPRRF